MKKAITLCTLLLITVGVFVWRGQRHTAVTDAFSSTRTVVPTSESVPGNSVSGPERSASIEPRQTLKVEGVNKGHSLSFGPALEELLAAAKLALMLSDRQLDELETAARRHHDEVYRAFAAAASVKILDGEGVIMRIQLTPEQTQQLRNTFFDSVGAIAGHPLAGSERNELRVPAEKYFDEFGANERVFVFTGNGAPLEQAASINHEQEGLVTQPFGRTGFRSGGTVLKEEFVSTFGPLAERALASTKSHN